MSQKTQCMENEWLIVTVADFGAELISVKDKITNDEYIWNGNPEFWKRHAPVLFPFVGSRKEKHYYYEGKEYSMGQHGFARDMEFKRLKTTEHKLSYLLEAEEETKKKYPFLFSLEITYELIDRKINITWKVRNDGDREMYFQIGAHPAFVCPIKSQEAQSEYYLAFNESKGLNVRTIDIESGLAKQETKEIPFTTVQSGKGYLKIDEHLFDEDALILEKKQCNMVELCRPDLKPYVTMTFDAPLFGVWSPAKKGAPFVCIEPWYGRCDGSWFEGELKDMEYINALQPGNEFTKGYSMEFTAIM